MTNVIITGGVACNVGLRAAAAAYPRFLSGHLAALDLRPKANFSLAML